MTVLRQSDLSGEDIGVVVSGSLDSVSSDLLDADRDRDRGHADLRSVDAELIARGDRRLRSADVDIEREAAEEAEYADPIGLYDDV